MTSDQLAALAADLITDPGEDTFDVLADASNLADDAAEYDEEDVE